MPNPLLLLLIGALTAIDFIQNGMVSFAAGPIMGEIGASPEEFSLIAAAYASIAIVGIALQRWCVERLGWRGYVRGALGIAAVGAMACGTAWSYETLLAGRMVMAVGCAGMMTSARLAVNLIPPGPGRIHGITALASGVCCGLASAPWLAATIVSADRWPMIFWLTAAAVLAMLAATHVLPADKVPAGQRSGAHPLRLVALAAGSFLLLYVLQRSYYDFYANRLGLVLGALAGVAALGGFIWAETRSARPLLKLGSLVEPRYLAGLALFTFCYMTLGSNGYLLPLVMQRSLGYSWSTTGNLFALGLAGGVLTWVAMSRMLPRWPGPRKYFMTGFAALAASAWLLSRLPPAPDPWLHVLPALGLYGVFIMTMMPTTAMHTFMALGRDESVFSHAQQTKNMMGEVGKALGVMLATVGQQWLTVWHYTRLQGEIHPGNPHFQEVHARITAVLSASMDPARAADAALAQIAQMLTQQSVLLANLDHFRGLAMVAVLAIAVSAVQKALR
ncbi:MFS transporter [Cupriavidus agavae]|uniref:MFS transporter n=1 Tax=Cupriavidus agavae TaxID=1001822 RepID=A0A4V2FH83_9BURK|nr:MFS transporter [Cupriavidus agavae]RZT39379.1 MFS transporter [Cupriavidus agavae]